MNQQETAFPFWLFLALSYLSALFFEEVPRLILRDTNVWGTPAFVVFFLIEYGIIFGIAYALFQNKPARHTLVFGVIFGILWETFVMHKLNSVAIGIIFAILYALMFWVPFKARAIILERETVTKRSMVTACILLLSIIIALLPLAQK